MNILTSPELARFREEVRAFLKARLTPELVAATRSGPHVPRPLVARWQGLLHAQGWAAPHWPTAWGGTGWNEAQRYVFEEETALADAPLGDVLGLFLAGPLLIAEGSEQQKARFLPPILSGSTFWCQGFSEPGAGSNLASLTTSARLDGDSWVISGQKTWLTGGHEADMMFLLARTETQGRPQQGLSIFLVDMQSPGLSLRPILTMDEAHSVNALFLDEVRVPGDALVGTRGQGWQYAKDLLARERVNNAQAPRTKRDIVELDRLARTLQGPTGTPLIEDAGVLGTLAALVADFVALESAVIEVIALQVSGLEPGPIASTLKIRGSELQQRVTETAMDWLAERAVLLGASYGDPSPDPAARGWTERHLFRRVVTIYAGSNEIQKNIIAKSLLGM